MKIYNTIKDYIPNLKSNDIIVFGGKGIVDGISSLQSKHDTYKVIQHDERGLITREYRGRINWVLPLYEFDQKVAVLESKEYKELPVLW